VTELRDEAIALRGLMVSLRRREIDRREFLLLAAGTSAAAIIAACSPTASPSPAASGPAESGAVATPAPTTQAGGRKTVPLYTTENDPSTLAFYASVIAAFQGEFPDVDVPITLYQDENQLQYLTTAFQTGTDLGVFGPPPSSIADWARAGFLLPVTGVIKEIGEADFLDGTRVVVDGEDYAMPFQANASVLYYRKDLLGAAGIAQPTTYDEYLAAVTALNGKDGIVGIASSVSPAPQLPLQFFTPYVHQAGWDYFNKDGEVRFDQPEVLDAVKRYVAIMANTTENFYNAGFGDIQTAYIGGQAAFATFPGRLGVNLDRQAPAIADVTGVMGIPAGPFMTGQLHFGGTQHYSISSKTAHPDEAQAFLEALTTGDNALAFALTVPGHLLPPLESVRQKLRVAEDPYIQKHQDWMTTFLDLVPGAMNPSLSMGSVDNKAFTKKLSNVCPWGSEVWTTPPVDGDMLQEILINKKDPEAAWTDANKKLGDIATKWKAANPGWTPSS
jgi:ABC-type glycerol-3-phosphate transport system substrate-binding protein